MKRVKAAQVNLFAYAFVMLLAILLIAFGSARTKAETRKAGSDNLLIMVTNNSKIKYFKQAALQENFIVLDDEISKKNWPAVRTELLKVNDGVKKDKPHFAAKDLFFEEIQKSQNSVGFAVIDKNDFTVFSQQVEEKNMKLIGVVDFDLAGQDYGISVIGDYMTCTAPETRNE